jgi:hypothetical protein
MLEEGNRLTLSNTVDYYNTEFITTVKKFCEMSFRGHGATHAQGAIMTIPFTLKTLAIEAVSNNAQFAACAFSSDSF